MSAEVDVSGSGAMAQGTIRDLAPVMKAKGWRWSRNLRAWFLPRTWRHETVDMRVEQTVEALAEVGVAAEVVGHDDRDREDERAARRLERDAELIDLHEARAQRAEGRAQASWDKARQISDVIPMGQPVLRGHHSEGRHRRDLGRIHDHMRKGTEASKDAKQSRAKAASARQRVARSGSDEPRFVPDDVRKGDLVQHRSGSWHRVLRVNAKSVTIPALVGGESVSWTDRLPWDKIRDVQRPEQALDRLKGEAMARQASLPGLEQ